MKRDRVLLALEQIQRQMPKGFVDDGCSAAPDRIFGRDLRPACRVHDYFYCTRAWPAGQMDQAHRERADTLLGAGVRSLLPRGLGWLGWLYWCSVHQFGGDDAYDSCGRQAGKRCRHNLPKPAWMLGSRR